MTEKIYHFKHSDAAYTFGIEIETNIVSNHQKSVAADIATALNRFYNVTSYIIQETREHSGRAWAIFNNGVKLWIVETDASCYQFNDRRGESYCLEIVSPPYTAEKMREELPIILDILNNKYECHCNNTNGLHIHIGHKDYNSGVNALNYYGFTLEHIKKLAVLMYNRYDIITKAAAVRPAGLTNWAKNWENPYGGDLISDIKRCKTYRQMRLLFYGMSNETPESASGYYAQARYRALNLNCLFGSHKNGTIEFRMFNGSSDFNEIMAYIDFVAAITYMAERQNRISDAKETRKTEEEENPKYAFRTFINKMGLIGDEFKQTRKVLRRNLTGISNTR